METSSFGLLFGCAGAAAAFYGTQFLVKRKYGLAQDAEPSGEEEKIRRAYSRLFLLRLGCLILSLAAVCIWFLEPAPYAAGLLGAGACLLLWKAFRLRSRIMKQAKEAENRLIAGAATAGPDLIARR